MAGQGIKKLRKIQLGKETTAGTAVDATTVWRGMGTIEDGLEKVFVDEDIGYKSGVDRTYIPKVEARLDLDEIPATYEQILHILEAAVEEDEMTGVMITEMGEASFTGKKKIQVK